MGVVAKMMKPMSSTEKIAIHLSQIERELSGAGYSRPRYKVEQMCKILPTKEQRAVLSYLLGRGSNRVAEESEGCLSELMYKAD